MLPAGLELDVYEAVYVKITVIFGSSALNKEDFDRRSIKDLLPDPSKPKRVGSKTSGKGPWITVVGHELEAFSKEEWDMLKVPKGLGEKYTQPYVYHFSP